MAEVGVQHAQSKHLTSATRSQLSTITSLSTRPGTRRVGKDNVASQIAARGHQAIQDY